MNSLWRKSASIKEASLTRDVSRLNCYAIPNLQPTTSASEANVEFHDIVAAVGESQMNAMIPDVMQLLTFYSVCPASTATSAERSFSHLRCIKSYLRNTMSQQRLVSLMLLSAYKLTLSRPPLIALRIFLTIHQFLYTKIIRIAPLWIRGMRSPFDNRETVTFHLVRCILQRMSCCTVIVKWLNNDTVTVIFQMAPHTLFDLVSSEWQRPYSRELATFPLVSWILYSVRFKYKY